jgi:hypothetical protein
MGKFTVVPSALTLGKCAVVVVAVTALGITTTPADAEVTFSTTATGSDRGELSSATAMFDLSISGTVTDLVVTLTNTAKTNSHDLSDILTGVFFELPGDPILSRISAILNSNCVPEGNQGVTDPGGCVGGEWAYGTVSTRRPPGVNEGICSSGLGLLGQKDLFPYNNLEGPLSPAGIQYGPMTLYETILNDKRGICGQGLIESSVVFTLGDVPANCHLSDISDVCFEYGTGCCRRSISEVPEPSAFALAAAGLLAAIFLFGRHAH